MIELHLRARQIVAAHEDAVSNAWWQGLLFGVSLLLALLAAGTVVAFLAVAVKIGWRAIS